MSAPIIGSPDWLALITASKGIIPALAGATRMRTGS